MKRLYLTRVVVLAGLMTPMAVAQTKPGAASRPATTQPASQAPASDLYLLDTCPVSGEKLGSMGDAIVKTIEGREVRFCCGGCIGRYSANTAKYNAVIDKAIAKQQMPFYPLETCVVTGEPLIEEGKDIGVDHVYRNRLVRLCCTGCVRDFDANPAKYLEILDKAVIKAQSEGYPLKDCVVLQGSKLGSMGDPVEIVAANRLVKFCCARCQKKFRTNPAPFIARLDQAWKPIHEARTKRARDGHTDHRAHDHVGHDHDEG